MHIEINLVEMVLHSGHLFGGEGDMANVEVFHYAASLVLPTGTKSSKDTTPFVNSRIPRYQLGGIRIPPLVARETAAGVTSRCAARAACRPPSNSHHDLRFMGDSLAFACLFSQAFTNLFFDTLTP